MNDNEIFCGYCNKSTIAELTKYWFQEAWYIQGSKKVIPFCSCKCGVDYYHDNGFLEKSVLKNVKNTLLTG